MSRFKALLGLLRQEVEISLPEDDGAGNAKLDATGEPILSVQKLTLKFVSMEQFAELLEFSKDMVPAEGVAVPDDAAKNFTPEKFRKLVQLVKGSVKVALPEATDEEIEAVVLTNFQPLTIGVVGMLTRATKLFKGGGPEKKSIAAP